MLAGLNAEAARRAACAWAANLEYEAPAEPASGGWYGDFLELKYRPRGHADPVVRAWIEFAAAAVGKAEDEDEADRARELRDSLLSPKDGAGACIKCHAVTAAPAEGETVEDTERVRIEWTYGERADRPNFFYSHGAHFKLVSPDGVAMMDPALGCATCHKLSESADFAAGFSDFNPFSFSSSFTSITKETCAQCHAAGQVRQDCQLCHRYHLEPGFKLGVMRNGG